MDSAPPGPMIPGTDPSSDDAALSAAVRRLARTSVTVIGDVMLDRYIYGVVDRVSPEAPIPILRVERETAMPGGAGNVVRNLTALGAAVAFVSVVGDDQAGSDLTGLVGGQPGIEPWMLIEGARTTTVKTRFVSQGQQLLRADREQNQPISQKLAERMLRIAGDTLAATSVTVLSDYAKGVLSGRHRSPTDRGGPAGRTTRGGRSERDAIMPVMPVRTSSRPTAASWRTRRGCRSIEEADLVLGLPNTSASCMGSGRFLVTRSEDGMTLVDADGAHHFPAEAIEVFDVSGAGDTVVATLAAGLAAGIGHEGGGPAGQHRGRRCCRQGRHGGRPRRRLCCAS